MSLRFLHLNIEGRRHLERIGAFLDSNEVDVLCLQEVCSDTAHIFKEKYGFVNQVFAEMGYWYRDESHRNISIMSKLPIIGSQNISLPVPNDEYKRRGKIDVKFFLLKAVVKADGKEYHFVTTHLPLYFDENGNKDGWIISEYQIQCLDAMKKELAKMNPFLLTGDFNAPRGTVIFDDLAKAYKDNMPNDVTSTIDPVLHRAPHLQLVVDGAFTTNGYTVSDIKVLEGLSDHKGISGVLTVS